MLRSLLSGGLSLSETIVYILSALAVVFLTLPIHEFAHGFAAVKLGDNTPRWQGRLTLNPFAHIDYMGALCILLFGFGWAKPVQVNHNNFRNPKRDMAITALAGPVSNIILAFVAMLLYNATYLIFFRFLSDFTLYVAFFFFYVAQINVYLAVFNLIPIPPLDGSRILTALLPYKYYYKLMRYERYSFLILILLLSTDVLNVPLNYLSGNILNGLDTLARLPFELLGLGI